MKIPEFISRLRSIRSLYQASRNAKKSRKQRPASVELMITPFGVEFLGVTTVIVGCVGVGVIDEIFPGMVAAIGII